MPLVVLIFILYFGLSRSLGITVSTFTALVAGLMLYNGSVLAEVFRAGVNALPRGQREAAYALGHAQDPGDDERAAPAGAAERCCRRSSASWWWSLKDTALGFLILYPELLYQARTLGSQGQLGSPILQVALVIAVIYIAMCLLLSTLANYLERRSRRSGRAARPGGGAPRDPELAAAPPGPEPEPSGRRSAQRFSTGTGSMPSAAGSSKPSTWA